jgi:hypothetical protein
MTKDGMTRKIERRKRKASIAKRQSHLYSYFASKLLRNHVFYPIPVFGKNAESQMFFFLKKQTSETNLAAIAIFFGNMQQYSHCGELCYSRTYGVLDFVNLSWLQNQIKPEREKV